MSHSSQSIPSWMIVSWWSIVLPLDRQEFVPLPVADLACQATEVRKEPAIDELGHPLVLEA